MSDASSADREPVPGGVVASSHGRVQIPVLGWVIRVLLGLAVLATLIPGAVGTALATAAVVILVATPLLRMAWLVSRWAQESDRRFVLTGVGLLAVVAVGALVSILGIGR